jgi:organic hydroperoxide reductase OsmC/OhrA
MLFFLFIAAQGKVLIDRYEDAAEGWLEIAANGRLAMTRVKLRPTVWFGSVQKPDKAEIIRLHEKAHARCFLANSVLSSLIVEPVFLNESRG